MKATVQIAFQINNPPIPEKCDSVTGHALLIPTAEFLSSPVTTVRAPWRVEICSDLVISLPYTVHLLDLLQDIGPHLLCVLVHGKWIVLANR
jgi:triacylglycerol esterase/lipase EstA (alpha/beta hydrolase family)